MMVNANDLCFKPITLQASGYHVPPSEYTGSLPYLLTKDFKKI